MNISFEHSNSTWVRYSEYEWKQAELKAFAEKYRLFGMMTALPTTPSFTD